jgi:hypothetical protein
MIVLLHLIERNPKPVFSGACTAVQTARKRKRCCKEQRDGEALVFPVERETLW